MKKMLSKKGIVLIALTAILVIIAGITGWKMVSDNKQPVVDNAKEMEFNFYEVSYEKLADPDDVGVMIMDCDSRDYFATLGNAYITNRKGTYVQGTGALALGTLENTAVSMGYFENVDISAYEKGSVHMSLYVSDPKLFANMPLYFELTSGGTYDVEEMCWAIHPSLLKEGWNDLYLGINDAILTGGGPDFKKINFYRIFTYGAEFGLDVIVDSVYATNTPGMSLEAKGNMEVETASTKPGYLCDFDTLDGLKSNGTLQISDAKGEYKEGKAGVVVSNPAEIWIMANLNPFDMTPYQNGGVSYWVYINDASYIKDGLIYLELTSSGTIDKDEVCWKFPGSELKTGWNEVKLSFNEASSRTGQMDFKKVNYLRMYGLKCSENLIAIVDAVKPLPVEKVVPSDGMILNCDSLDVINHKSENKVSITNAAGEFKEGKGAIKSVGKGVVWFQGALKKVYDVSKYADGGIHLWVYVSDPTQLKSGVTVEISSSGTHDKDEYQWNASGLKKGWNELKLSFESATKAGNPDLSSVSFLRIFAQTKGEITAIIDDVRAIDIQPKPVIPGMLLDCDDTETASVGSTLNFEVTNKEGEYKQGTGAYKAEGKGTVWYQAKLKKPIDLSDDTADGLCFWLYVSDPSKLKSSPYVEITSSGTYDKEEYQWTLQGLKEGWNEVKLEFAKATKSKNGTLDLSKVNYMRVFTPTANEEDVTIIMDHVRVDKIEKVQAKEGQILSCDDIEKLATFTADSHKTVSVTSAPNEIKEGTGAFKSLGNGQVRIYAKFHDDSKVDLSAYKTGSVQFWLYIGDISKMESTQLTVEMTSAGQPDRNALKWHLPLTGLKSNDWNQVTLKFANANASGGEFDYTAMNFMRLYFNKNEASADTLMILDDICAVKAEEAEKPQAKEGQLLSCDDTDKLATFQADVQKNLSVTTTAGEFKEGTGAFKSAGTGQVRMQFKFKDDSKVDLTAYKTGSLQFWLYMGDISKMASNQLTVELTSGGQSDKNEIAWYIPLSGLKSNDWNLVTLKFADGSASNGGLDYTAANFMRLYFNKSETSADTLMILDDVCAVKAEEAEKPQVKEGQILSCDDIEKLATFQADPQKNLSVTTTAGEFKEGTGAFKSAGTGQVRMQFKFKDDSKVDLTAYKTGSLQFWLYMGDISKMVSNQLTVELTSGGQADKNEIAWYIPLSSLKSNDWNLVTLKFADGSASKGGLDYAAANFMRLYFNKGETSADTLMILDDVCAVKGETPGQLWSFDNTEGLSNIKGWSSAVTTTTGEFKEGTGAMKFTGSALEWFKFVSTTKDISEYASGSLKLWIYISDATKLKNNVYLELGSAGKSDNNEHQWTISGLKTGWQELDLEFAKAQSKTGTTDFSKINWFRIFGECTGEMTVMIDDVRAAKAEQPEQKPEQPQAKEGQIFNCDNKDKLASLTCGGGITLGVTTTAGEFKEGTGAIKGKGAGQVHIQMKFKDDSKADISAYKTGSLQFWLYVGDLSKMTSTHLNVEVTSSGQADKNEMDWRIPLSDLKSNDWNLVTLKFAEGTPNQARGAFDYSAMNFMRLFFNKSETNADTLMILDDLCAVKEESQIFNCDNKDKLASLTCGGGITLGVTTTAGEFKEGTGAIKGKGAGQVHIQMKFKDDSKADISAYKTGSLQFWLYVGDLSKMTSTHLNVEVTSSGQADKNEMDWRIPLSDLKSNDWNLVTLKFAEGTPNQARGAFDYSAMNFMRLFFNKSETNADTLMILDDVRAVK